jgi:hypothetical protein
MGESIVEWGLQLLSYQIRIDSNDKDRIQTIKTL